MKTIKELKEEFDVKEKLSEIAMRDNQAVPLDFFKLNMVGGLNGKQIR